MEELQKSYRRHLLTVRQTLLRASTTVGFCTRSERLGAIPDKGRWEFVAQEPAGRGWHVRERKTAKRKQEG